MLDWTKPIGDLIHYAHPRASAEDCKALAAALGATKDARKIAEGLIARPYELNGAAFWATLGLGSEAQVLVDAQLWADTPDSEKPAPTAVAVFDHLVAEYKKSHDGAIDPSTRIELHRQVQDMDEHQRREAIPAPFQKPPAPIVKKEDPPRGGSAKTPSSMSDSELDAHMALHAGFGDNVHAWRATKFPSEILAARSFLRDNDKAAPQDTPASRALERHTGGTKLDVTSKEFLALDPSERMELFRQSQGGAK